VIVGGSYLREDIVPNWSDLDVVCVTDSDSQPNLEKISRELSEKYNIRFNPKLLTTEDLNNPHHIALKILMFFLPEYPSEAIHGVKKDLGLRLEGLKAKNRVGFYQLSRFYDWLEDKRETGSLSEEEFTSRGLRVCFNLTRIALFDKGHVVSSYEDTIRLAAMLGEKYQNQLKNLVGIRKNWGYESVDFVSTTNQIKGYISNIRGYFEDE